MNKAFLLIVSVYISFLYAGTISHDVATINLNMIAALAVLLILAIAGVFGRHSVGALEVFLLLAFFFLMLPSVLVSNNLRESTFAYFTFAAYGISILFPLYIFRKRINFIMYSSVFLGGIWASIILLISYRETSNLIRLQVFNGSDTNHLAFGLGLLIINLTNVANYTASKYGRVACRLGQVFFGLAVILLLSRTVILGLTGGAIGSLLIVALRKNNFTNLFKLAGLIVPVFVLVTAIIYWYYPSTIGHAIYRFTEARLYENRIILWSDALNQINTLSDFMFGVGYYELNPHNEFVKYLAASGFLGLLWLIIFLFGVYRFRVWPLRTDMHLFFVQNWLFLYMIAYLSTYGHNKTFWLAPSAILIFYLRDIEKDSLGSRRSSVPVRSS